MKKIFALLMALTLTFVLAACGQNETAEECTSETTHLAKTETQEETEINGDVQVAETDTSSETEDIEVSTGIRIKITVGNTELYATFEDNATTRELIEQMPMTLSMMDLYGREMCYRYGAYALTTDDLQSDGYEIGDIVYWAPGGSLVILYAQNGEHFERQHLGHIDSGVEIFETTGDMDVTFEVADD